MRNADELSITVAPARTAMGAKRFEVLPPAENSAMSTPLKLCSFSSRTVSCRPRNVSVCGGTRRGEQPQFRHREASHLQAANHSTPTAPVAPTIATTARPGHDLQTSLCSPIHKRQRPRRVSGGPLGIRSRRYLSGIRL